MRIYTRAEWNARPPSGAIPSGLAKKYIIIHHTASGNEVQSEAADLSYQYSCQGWHMAQYNAVDILQGFTVFKSGRVMEGRMPWDSNNGAIYNAGGGQVDGVGIECDGTFYADGALMGATQYNALVALCREIVARCRIDTTQDRWIYGHREIYPCRPGDPKETSCPGNLLAQFVTNGKLQRDVLGGQPEEEEMALITSGAPVKLFSATVNVDADGDAWTKVYNPGGSAVGGRVSFSTSKAVSFTVQPNKVAAFGAKSNGATGETQITVTSDAPVTVTIKQ
jgi:hypothetical protein